MSTELSGMCLIMSLDSPKQFAIARKYLNLTQEQIAKEIGITRIPYNKIENGESDPKWSTVKKLLDYFEDKGITFHDDGNVTLSKEN